MSCNLKLIACDLDRTLMDSVPILPEVREFITQIHKRGVVFAINSGRSVEDILHILCESDIDPAEGYPEIIISQHGMFIHYLKGKSYVGDEKWNQERKEEMEILHQEIGWKSKLWEKMVEQDLKISPQKKKVAYGIFEMLFNNDEEAERVRKILLSENNLRYTTFLRNRHFLIATLATALKGHSLSRAAQHFKIPPSCVLAMGDSQNDEDMLNGNYGFIPAAPSNAEPEIKSLVESNRGYVASLPTGKGVIEVVSLLLDRPKG